MASSDRIRFHVGDRVRDRQTGEQGRIIDIRAVPEGGLLIAVAIFAGATIRRQFQFRTLPGQIAGLPIEKIATTVESRGAEITTPLQGAGVSHRAIERARRNLPVSETERKLLRPMTEREIQKLARERADWMLPNAEQIASKAAPKLAQLQRVEERLRSRHARDRELLSYLTRSSKRKFQQVIKDGEEVGQVAYHGSYISDVLFRRSARDAEVQSKVTELGRLLRSTRLGSGGAHTDHFLSKYRHAFSGRTIESFETAFDVFQFAQAQVAALPPGERARSWRGFGRIIEESVRERNRTFVGRQLGLQYLRGLRESARDIYSEFRTSLEGAPYNPVLDIEGIKEARTPAGSQIDFGTPRAGLADDLLRPRIGVRTANEIIRDTNPDNLFKAQLVRVQGRLYKAREVVTRGAEAAPYVRMLEPVQSPISLFAGFNLFNEFEHMGVLEGIAQAEVGSFDPIRPAPSATRVPTFGNLQLRGGLFGNRPESVSVRGEFVRAFLTGEFQGTRGEERIGLLYERLFGRPIPPTITPEIRQQIRNQLQQLGFYTETSFFDAAQKASERFLRELREVGPQAGGEDAVSLAYQHLVGDPRAFTAQGPITLEALTKQAHQTAWDAATREARRPTREPIIAKSLDDAEAMIGERISPISQGETFGITTMAEVQSNFQEYLRSRGRLGGVSAFQEAFGASLTRPERAVLAVERADRIAALLATKGQKKAARRAMARFSEAVLGAKILEDPGAEYLEAFDEHLSLRRQIRLAESRGVDPDTISLLTAQAADARERAEALKLVQVNTRAKENFVRNILESERTPTYGITPANEADAVRQMNAVLAQANATGPEGPLRGTPFDLVPLREGKFGIRLFSGENRTGASFIYRSTGDRSGVASLVTNPNVQIGLGEHGNLPMTVTDYQALAEAGQIQAITDPVHATRILESQEKAIAGIQKASADAAKVAQQEAAIVGAANREVTRLPIYRLQNGQLVGYAAENVASFETMRKNVQDLLENKRSFIGLDIETQRETGRITNVHASRWEWRDGKLVRTGEQLDLATPRFFNAHEGPDAAGRVRTLREAVRSGGPISEELRTIRRHGHNVPIGEIVAGEKELIQRAASFLGTSDDIILGHNIPFDVGGLIQRAEATGLRGEARRLKKTTGRLADTLLGSQVAFPNQSSLSLQELYRLARRDVGAREAHVGGPDIEWTAAVQEHIAKNRAVAEAFGSAEQVTMESPYFYSRGRGFKFLGLVDPQAAQKQVGSELEAPFGMIAQPIDFTTMKPRGEAQVIAFRTPAGFAKAFRTMQIGTLEETGARMSAKVLDLARDRMRRMQVEHNKAGQQIAFEELLKERERFALSQAHREGRLDEAMGNLFRRHLETESPAMHKLYSDVANWRFSKHFEDSRIHAQIAHQGGWWGREVPQHQPVIDWLEEHFAAGNVREANVAWSEYLKRTTDLSPWATVAGTQVPPENQKISFKFSELGENARGIRVGSREMVQSDLNDVVRQVASRIQRRDPNTIKGLLVDESRDVQRQTLQLLRKADSEYGGWELPGRLQEHVWSRYVRPAMAQGGTASVANAENGPFRLGAHTMAGAVEELLAGGQEAAQKYVESLTDPTVSREFDRAALGALQAEFMSKTPAEIARQAAASPQARAEVVGSLLFQKHHRVGDELVGRSVEGVMREAIEKGTVPLMLDDLKRASRWMSTQEYLQLRKNVAEVNPDWLKAITPTVQTASTAAEVAAETLPLPEVTRAFRPGRMNTRAVELADQVFERREAIRSLGLLALGATAALGLVNAVVPPQGPQEDPDKAQAQGMSSTDFEVQRRKTRQLHQIPAHHTVRVHISGEDPVGMDPTELSQSIHATMAQFINDQLERRSDVHDHRSRIDQQYLDRLAAKLMEPGQ